MSAQNNPSPNPNPATPAPSPKPNGNGNGKRKKIFIILAIFGALIIFAVAGHIIRGMTHVSTDDAYVEGRVHSIASKVPGTVLEVMVDDNKAVKKGDLLVQVDPQDYELRVNEATAALEAEKARLVDADASIKTAQVALDQATLDKNRADALFKANVIPKERSERADTAFNTATAQLTKARAFKELEASLIKQREAALATAKLNLGYTRIAAPADGYVTKKSVETGNQIGAGQPLMAVVALEDIWITANYKETELKNVRPGQAADITIDTYPGVHFRGKVDSIQAGTGAVFSLFPPENALGNYVKVVQRIPVKIVLEKGTDSKHQLRIGMSCVPTITTSE
ncbi:MAG: efflux RND transporter periplasmic adaptor subunit [Deltaproteobacteria bacterium]